MYNYIKRFIDVIFSLIIITIFSPFGISIVLILKFTGEGEILYRQFRVGRYGADFSLLKFATMIINSPNIGAGDITIKNDPRVLPFGKFLRKMKLNEFPQFINVLIGDMSLVGPRPLVRNQHDMFPLATIKIVERLKPGITGIGSIIFRDEEKYFHLEKENANRFYKDEIVPYKATLECWYEENESFFVDILLIITTIFIVVLPGINLYKYFFRDLPKHPLFNPE